MAAGTLPAFLSRLGVEIDEQLASTALTHRSYAYEHGGPDNERLELLGDSVLELVVTEHLYQRHPDSDEGVLAKMRAVVVKRAALAEVGRALGIGEALMLGHGEETSAGRQKSSILADAMEAVIGAVYLSGGLEPARELILRNFAPLIERASTAGAGLDWKTSLQERTAALGLGVPAYLVSSSGPAHERTFTAVVQIGGREYSNGTGANKKQAEMAAAERTFAQLAEPTGSAGD